MSEVNSKRIAMWKIRYILYVEYGVLEQRKPGYNGEADCIQIGFLTEWQLYAQKLEGDSWQGEKLDKRKLGKMSGQ
jgi:hypothetical protein